VATAIFIRRLPERRLWIQAVSTDILFNGESVVWNLGAGLLQPIFPRRVSSPPSGSAIARRDQAAAQYRQTVLKAFQDVRGRIAPLWKTDARTLQAQARPKLPEVSVGVIEKQYELGALVIRRY